MNLFIFITFDFFLNPLRDCCHPRIRIRDLPWRMGDETMETQSSWSYQAIHLRKHHRNHRLPLYPHALSTDPDSWGDDGI